jgi:nitrogen PTS system EIIA component
LHRRCSAGVRNKALCWLDSGLSQNGTNKIRACDGEMRAIDAAEGRPYGPPLSTSTWLIIPADLFPMALNDIVAMNAVIPALKVNSKKQAIQEIAARAATLSGLNERTIFETLLQREKLGSTGIGHGIAIPHGKLPQLDRLFGLFARLDRPIDFESLDGQPVDLIFLLLAPEGAGADHLKALARVARLLRDPDTANKLRESRDADALYAVLTMTPSAAA